MNKLIVLLFLIIFVFWNCSNFNKAGEKDENTCDFPELEQPNFAELESKLKGEWTYNFSMKKDSCYLYTKFKRIPSLLSFYSCSKFSEINLEKDMPAIYRLKSKNTFKDLCSVYEIKGNRSKETFPFNFSGSKNDEIETEIIHYYGDKFSVGKELMYYINFIEADTLVLSDNFSDSFNQYNKKNNFHFYLRRR